MAAKPHATGVGPCASLWPVLTATGLSLGPLGCAQASGPEPVYSIGRVQAVYDNQESLRFSQSLYLADASRRFLLEALDHDESMRDSREDATRFQLFFGGPLPDRAHAVFGWVGRADYVRVGTGERLGDLRLGGQLTIDRIGAVADWFRRHKLTLFVQAFPIRTNEDFGRVDTFTRFAFRFNERWAARGVVRTYHFTDARLVVFENDFIYAIHRRRDVLLRIGKANRDRPGLGEEDFSYGIGVRFNF